MLDSEFMNLQDDFRPNDNFSCWISDSLIELCLSFLIIIYIKKLKNNNC